MVQGQVPSERRMRIGEFAHRAGISVDAVRYYERRGVLQTAPRTQGGYRTFGADDLERVALARQLQQLGLTIAEVVEALSVHDGGKSCSSERWRLEEAAARIDAQLIELRRTRDHLRATIAACDDGHCLLVRPGRT